MNLRVLPAALAELHAALDHYTMVANQALGLAFVAEFERTAGLLLSNPQLGAVFQTGHRRYPMRRFPYDLIYRVQGAELVILAVAHHKRRPGYWRKRR